MPPARLKELIQQTSDARLEVCRECPHNSENIKSSGGTLKQFWRKDEHCDVCACPLLQKTKALHASCPLDPPKWERVVDDSRSIEIHNAIEDAEKRTDQ